MAVRISEDVFFVPELDALDSNDELTPLGRILARLPIEPRLGKMMIMGCIFQSVSTLRTAACLFASESGSVLVCLPAALEMPSAQSPPPPASQNPSSVTENASDSSTGTSLAAAFRTTWLCWLSSRPGMMSGLWGSRRQLCCDWTISHHHFYHLGSTARMQRSASASTNV